jgi:calcium binding protein 39
LQYIITTRPEVIIALCNGYDRRESAMPCGGILKEALKHDAVTALILYDEPSLHGQPLDLGSIDTDQPVSGKGVFWKFFDWIDKSLFEVSTDAFDTFRVSLGQSSFRHVQKLSISFTANPGTAQAHGGQIH